MSQIPSQDLIPESFVFKIQDLQIWYNPTIFNSVSALIRTQTLQFPLAIKQSSQGKLKLKNKLITNLQCYYDSRKHKYLPLKIQVDINLQYKRGKTLVKQFIVNLNEFKTGTNKTQRIKILKSVQRMFSVEIIFKLEDSNTSSNPNDSSGSTFKNQSRFISYRSNELSAMRHVRVPKTQVTIEVIKNQIQQVRSLNEKDAMMKSPKRMSDFLLASNKNVNNVNASIQESNLRNQRAIVSPKKEQYKHYVKHLENGVTSQEVQIKNSFVTYVQGDPYILEQHKSYATLTPSQYDHMQNQGTKFRSNVDQDMRKNVNDHHKINSQPNNIASGNTKYQTNQKTQAQTTHKIVSSQKIESSPKIQSYHRINSLQSHEDKQMDSLLLEEVKDLRKKLSDLFYEKNKLYQQKQSNLLEYETKDKQQKIRHRKQLTDQKKYYQELLRRKQLQLQQFKQKCSQIPTQIKKFNYQQHHYQLQTLDDSSERNVSITFEQQQVSGRNIVGDYKQKKYRNEVNENRNFMVKSGNNRQKKRIFQSTPMINNNSNKNNLKTKTIIVTDPNNVNQNLKNQHIKTHTQQHQKNNTQRPLNNELFGLSEIESSQNIITKLRQELSDKNKTISELFQFKQLAHDQQQQLSRLNQISNQLNLIQQQELVSHDKIFSVSTQPLNSNHSTLNPSHNQLQNIITKLSNHIQVLQEKIQFLQQTNTVLNQQYHNKISQLNIKQSQLNNDQEKLKQLLSQFNIQLTQHQQLQPLLNQHNNQRKNNNQLLQSQSEQVALKEQKLSQANKLLHGKDAQIKRLKNETQQLKSIIAKLNQKIDQLIEMNSQLYSNLQSLENEIKQSGNQQIALHNYHLNPQDEQMLNVSQQQKRNLSQTNDKSNSDNNVVKVSSIVRANRTQSKPQKPNMNTQYILVNQNNQNQNQQNINKNSKQIETITQRLHENLNNLQRNMTKINQQDARLNSIIRNNYHKEQLINQKNQLINRQQVNNNALALNNQVRSENQKVLPHSTIKVQKLNANNITSLNPNYNSSQTNQAQSVTINLNPPQTSTSKLIKIEQTPKRKSSPQQYPNEPVKVNQQNTPKPLKNPQNTSNNNNYASKNPTNNNNNNKNNKYVMKTVHYSAEKEPKATSIVGRPYQSTRNQKKRTRVGGDDSDDCGCC